MLQSLFYLTTAQLRTPRTTHSNQFQLFHSDNNTVKLLPDAVVTVVCAPEDG
jgi:hypothetical protein